jgi:hypothetical protein
MKKLKNIALLTLTVNGISFSSVLKYSVFGGISKSHEDVIVTNYFKKYQLFGLELTGEVFRQISAPLGLKTGMAYKYKKSDSFMYSYGLSYINIPLALNFGTFYNIGFDIGGRLNVLIYKNKGYKIVNLCPSPSTTNDALPTIQSDTVKCFDGELKVDVNEPYIHYNSTYFDAFININYSRIIFGHKNTIRSYVNLGLSTYRNIRKVDFTPFYQAEAIQFNSKNERDIELGLGYGFEF